MSSTVISTLSPGITISVSFGEADFTGAVHCTEIELRTVFVAERSMAAAFFFLQYVDGSFEF